MKTIRKMQHGFSLITAIFLLVVIATLGTFAMMFFTAQQRGISLDVLGTRAYQASRAGIEWGAYQLLPNSAVPGGFAANCRAGPASGVIAAPGTLANFTITVNCTSIAASEATATITMYQLISTATLGAVADQDYVERQITATFALRNE